MRPAPSAGRRSGLRPQTISGFVWNAVIASIQGRLLLPREFVLLLAATIQFSFGVTWPLSVLCAVVFSQAAPTLYHLIVLAFKNFTTAVSTLMSCCLSGNSASLLYLRLLWSYLLLRTYAVGVRLSPKNWSMNSVSPSASSDTVRSKSLTSSELREELAARLLPNEPPPH